MLERLRELLQTDQPEEELVLEVFAKLGFHDRPAANARFQRLKALLTDKAVRERCLEHLLLALAETPHPDVSLMHFERWLSCVGDPNLAAKFLIEQPRATEILLKLTLGSQFLTDTLTRHPESLSRLTQHRRLAEIKSQGSLYAELQAVVRHSDSLEEATRALCRQQRQELLRIAACDAFGLMDLRTVTMQLSLLAEVMIQVCLECCARDSGITPDPLCVLAMGKLGGAELNYSSDIDLIFLIETPAPEWTRLAQKIVRTLQNPTTEGFLYRVDLRLRPWGRAGELVTTRAAYQSYLRTSAENWERQALLKARVVAGNEELGTQFLREIEPIVFGIPASQVRESIRTAKSRIEADLRGSRSRADVKHGRGSIRDVEFITQALQLIHGNARPGIRSPNTLDALVRIADNDLLRADEYRSLSSGYLFLRTIEHALQLMHNTQEHAIPDDRRSLNYLARRLDFTDGDHLLAAIDRHQTAIRRVYDRHLGLAAAASEESPQLEGIDSGVVSRFRDVVAKSAALLLQTSADQPVVVSAVPLDDSHWRVVVAGVDYPGDLSMMSGLLFVYGFNIVDGIVTTGQHRGLADELTRRHRRGPGTRPRDFVNVFHVRPLVEGVEPEVWLNYQADLVQLLKLTRSGATADAQGRLVKRVAAALQYSQDEPRRLSPVEIAVDNVQHPEATILDISADDTMGFLYELSNALSLCGLDIAGVEIHSAGDRVVDRLLVTDVTTGGKILDPQRQSQLRAAIVLIKHFTHLLPRSPNPEAALWHFRELLGQILSRPNWMDELASIERPEVLSALARLLGVSDFLWEDFLRLQHANLFPLLSDLSVLETARTKAALLEEFSRECLGTSDRDLARRRLNELKDREMFRVDMRHILNKIPTFGEFSAELTDVAECVVDIAFQLAWRETAARLGEPHLDGNGPCRIAVLALGKCGGRELGFASDIELMFVYDGAGTCDGSGRAENSAFVQQLVDGFVQSIVARREGIFRIDLRMRPHGRSGNLGVTAESFRNYFAADGPAWPYERQALVKLRPIAGDAELGQQVVAWRDACVYTGEPFDFAAMLAIRERQVRQLVRGGTFNAKLSAGGLVDLEYLVQALQISHGKQHPELRITNTRLAIETLAKLGILSADEHKSIGAALSFLRRLIDALRMVRGDARNLTVPPVQGEEFEFLSRRLGYEDDTQRLQADLERHSRAVLDLQRKFHDESRSR
ncbi:MAG: glutamine synthetase adenylyltransferase [Planctomycetaceae bacterium]|nr:glutamine synthetase adenylyltransferase [Planctomycetaceae bacterium]